jgi:hypothetical protein
VPTHVRPTQAKTDDHLLINQTGDDSAPEMPEELKAVLDQKMKALDALLTESGKAKYKMELVFSKDRSARKTTVGMLCFFESGRRLHGGGDAKVYFCPGFRKNTWHRETEQWRPIPKGRGPCDAIIPDSSHGYEHLFCPKCKTLWADPEVYGEVVFNLPMQKWAEVMTKYYVRLECNADVVLKFSREDIRTKALLEQAKQRGGELLEKARAGRLRATAIYPLKNIIKDTGAGADLARQFYKFLRA